VQKIVSKHGKTAVGWDEIFVPGVPKDIMIHSWRGPKSLAAAAREGYHGILSNGYYLDLGWTAARHYAVDPTGGAAATPPTEEQKKKLSGGGAPALGAELVAQKTTVPPVGPPTPAFPERLWPALPAGAAASMFPRLRAQPARLEWLGLTHRTYYRKMLERI